MPKDLTLNELSKRALEIAAQYDKLNTQLSGRPWDAQELMAGFVGDVGDLSKIIMAKHGLRTMDDIDAKLAHELSDCLWSVLVISHKLNVDLQEVFIATMSEIEERLIKDLH